ncbi:MAG TPA: GDP-mannose 4,6-dehydratase [Gemmatimonadales bacterium]|nr:GDP-mannose 4,6-dehydratase [Gemmatimonadales bacterium]
MKIVVTGGCGFIGSHVAEHLREVFPEARLTILDKLTYAGDMDNVSHLVNRNGVRLVIGDICDGDLCRRVVHHADVVVHLAAESFVDNSFGDPVTFTITNTLGTHTLLEACRIAGVPRFIHVSTDEVYGEVLRGQVGEDAPFNPTNPYSASKAAAEMIILGYLTSYRQPIIRVRANNIFGIRQYPEKVIPKFCLSLVLGEKLTIHGNGSHRRHYLHARDFAAAVALLIDKGVAGEVYNVGSEDEYSTLEVAEMVCDVFGKECGAEVVFVKDRPFNDRRYSISSARMQSLGWRAQRRLVDELCFIAQWYAHRVERYRHLFVDAGVVQEALASA